MLYSSRKFSAMLCLTLIFSLVIVSPAFCQTKKLKLGFGTSANEKDPYFITATKFAELVKQYTNNRYEVDIFGGSQLGNDTEMIKNLSMGTMDIGVITNAPVGSFVNAFMVLDLPFIFPNADVAYKVLDGPAGKMLLSKLSSLQITGLAFSEGGFRQMVNNIRPVNTPEDLKGVKYRVMKSPVYIGMFQSLGANAVPMPWGEVFSAVQQKVIDGLEIPVPVVVSNKLYEVTKYLSLTGHTYSPLVIMVSNMTWNRLSQIDRENFQKAAQDTVIYERRAMAQIVDDYLKEITEAGMKINDVADKKPFQDSVAPMYNSFEKKIGTDVMKAIITARDEAEKTN